MNRPKFTIKRMLFGMVLVALPFAAFSSIGTRGIVVAAGIGVATLIACLFANRPQFESMIGILVCTAVGILTGLAIQPATQRRGNDTAIMIASSLGCLVGLTWSYVTYDVRSRKNDT